MLDFSNGNSFNGDSAYSNGHSMSVTCPREPWIWRLLSCNQDRGGL